MSYRIRGEVSVDVEDYHYNGDIEVASDAEGISELMSENNITTAELVEYQNQHTDDCYTLKPTKEDVIAYTDALEFREIIEILDSYLGKLRYLYLQEQQMCTDLQSEKEALKLKIRDLQVEPVASIDTSARIS